jgi:hypothetical protein
MFRRRFGINRFMFTPDFKATDSYSEGDFESID